MILKNKHILNICSVCIGMMSLLTIPIHTSAETVTSNQQCHSTNPLDFHSTCKSEAIAWGNERFNLWNKLTPQVEKDAIRGYTALDYGRINGYLRSDYYDILDQEKVEQSIKQIDRAFSRDRLHDDIIVYRRVGERAFGLPESSLVKRDVKEDDSVNSTSKIDMERFNFFKNIFQGKYKKDPAYMSTSIVKDAAAGFDELPILLKIHVPKGVPAIYVAPVSQVPEEMELLLPRNRTYKVINISPIVEKDKEYVMLDVEILDIESNYRNKRSTDIIYEDSLPSLAK
ncbi:ADP-ribosyltransferase (plasmid) [Bacillus cereus]|uniref:ADP-ribosyltransferase n=1 Tax=Bacillus cereus TaxID=1396 RepID=UPI001F2E8B5B|nr:ADP-ribosyltransferase [Bacillus cereus]UIJ69790.1 ADP-ribosyltransferase [Bacillus cereus]